MLAGLCEKREIKEKEHMLSKEEWILLMLIWKKKPKELKNYISSHWTNPYPGILQN